MDTDMSEQNQNTDTATPNIAVPKKRRRWLKVVLGIIILLCGFVLGSGTTIVVMHEKIMHTMHDPELVAKKITWRLSWWLNLSEEQKAKVHDIVIKRHRALKKIFVNTWPKVERELNLFDQEITKVLNPKQAAKWQKKFRKMRKRWSPPPSCLKMDEK
jgi:hypothetical protein